MLDLKSVRLTKIEEAEIATGLRSWAAAHLYLMGVNTSDDALKALVYAIKAKRPRDMIQRLLHRYSSLNRKEMAVQASKSTGLEIV